MISFKDLVIEDNEGNLVAFVDRSFSNGLNFVSYSDISVWNVLLFHFESISDGCFSLGEHDFVPNGSKDLHVFTGKIKTKLGPIFFVYVGTKADIRKGFVQVGSLSAFWGANKAPMVQFGDAVALLISSGCSYLLFDLNQPSLEKNKTFLFASLRECMVPCIFLAKNPSSLSDYHFFSDARFGQTSENCLFILYPLLTFLDVFLSVLAFFRFSQDQNFSWVIFLIFGLVFAAFLPFIYVPFRGVLRKKKKSVFFVFLHCFFGPFFAFLCFLLFEDFRLSGGCSAVIVVLSFYLVLSGSCVEYSFARRV